MQDYSNEIAQLREELASNYTESDLDSASLEELLEMKADIELYEFLDGEIENFTKENICSRDDLIKSIRETKAQYQHEAKSGERKHALAYYNILDSLLGKFEHRVMCTVLPDPLNEWWSYSYEISDGGINLLMNHFSWNHYGNSYDYRRDEAFILLEVPAKLLTVSEYAQIYGVEPVTVRQWIRRAKLRSAVKAGKEWRIPELAEVSKERGYRPCLYSWSKPLTDLPEKYDFLSEFKKARFWQDEESNDFFCVELYADQIGLEVEGNEDWECLQEGAPTVLIEDDNSLRLTNKLLKKYPDLNITEDGILKLTARDREDLELYMISNPLVRCFNVNSREGALAYNIVEFGNGYGDWASISVG